MVRNGTRYYQIAEYYRRMIEEKEVTVGEKMPTEEQICALFQVSRITARQAMSQLVQGGYIERVQGKGSYVKAKKGGYAAQPFAGLYGGNACQGYDKHEPCAFRQGAALRLKGGGKAKHRGRSAGHLHQSASSGQR